MKKIRVIALMLCICMCVTTAGVSAKLGDVEGYTKYTDIVAYINHYAIESYNLNGMTVVVAEDLANFGMNVQWDGDNRCLYITRNKESNEIQQYSVPCETPYYKWGRNALPVLSTDIRTFINSVEARSYNIGGKTVVDFESLSAFGPVVWNPDSRLLKLWVEDGLSMRYDLQPLQLTPPATLYSTDGRTWSQSTYNEPDWMVELRMTACWYLSPYEANIAKGKPYTNYHNTRYGFSIDLPTFFGGGEIGPTNDGVVMETQDGSVYLCVAGDINLQLFNYMDTVDEFYDYLKRNESGTVRRNGNCITVQDTRDGYTYYTKYIIKSDMTRNYFEFIYPTGRKNEFEPVLKHLIDTFKTGKGDQSDVVN